MPVSRMEEKMWRRDTLRVISRLNNQLNTTRLGRMKVVSDIKHSLKPGVMNILAPDNVVLTTLDGFKFYVYAETREFWGYTDAPVYEPYTAELFRMAVKPGATVLDVGAQFGYFSLLAAKQAGPTGRVFAFEPAPSNFRLLCRNVRENGYSEIISPMQKGVDAARQVATLNLFEGSDSHGMYHPPSASIKTTVQFECVAIDDFAKDMSVDVIKMDIEGNEFRALKGMGRTIAKSKNLTLFTELAPAYLRLAGGDSSLYVSRLEELGFEVNIADEKERCLRRITSDLLLAAERESEREPSWHANLYCVRR